MATKARSAEVSDHTGGEGAGPDGVRRRDFIYVAAVSFAGVGALATLAPLIVQMSPSADVLAQATTEIDISKVQVGQRIKALWRKQPVFVPHLTPKEVAEAEAVPVSSTARPTITSGPNQAGKSGLARRSRRVHPPRLHSAWNGRRGEPRSVRRLFLPMPRLHLRYGCADSPRPGTEKSRGAGLRILITDDGRDRPKGEVGR